MEKYLESPLFARITGEEAKRMLNCAKARYRDYNAGSIIFGEDDKPKNLYLLLEGKVQVVKNLPSGKRNLLFQVNELEVFGASCPSESSGCYWYEAVAVKPSRVLILPFQFIYGFCSNVCEHHKMIIRNLLDIQANEGIQNFEAEDVTVEAGEDIDAIVVNLAIQPVDSAEKIYVTITVN